MKHKIDGLKRNVSLWLGNVPKKVGEVPSTKVVQWLLFILLVLVTTALISYRGGKLPAEIKVGQIAPYDIKADRDYEIVDQEATAKSRAEALQNVKSTYTFDPYLGAGLAERLRTAFEEMRRLIKTYSAQSSEPTDKFAFKQLSEGQMRELKNTWVNMVGADISPKDWKFLIDNEFSDEMLDKIDETIITIMSNPIIPDLKVLLEEKDKGVAVRVLPAAGDTKKAEETNWDLAKMESAITVEEMKKDVLKGKYIPENLSIDVQENRMVISISAALIQPNMIFDTQETEVRKNAAMKDIKNSVISLQSGESIIRGGSRYEPWHLKVLEGIRAEKSARSLPLEMVGSFLLIFTIYLVVFLFGRRYVRKFAPARRDMVFMGALMILMLLILRISMFLTSAIYGITLNDIPRAALTYAIPLAAAAMLIRFIINCETAALFAVVLAAFSGLVMQGNVYFTAFTLISSLAAAFSISHVDKRSSIIQSGILAGLINAVIVISIHLINAASVIEPLSLNNALWYLLSAFINGVSCAVFVLVIAPLAESVFGYTTDIKLLELANLNHPLLRELIIRAPGTYHHSHLVGILAETAAEAVAANPLLARVAAYYHDIGKIKKPQYFTENMPEGENVHENLSPHMSALVIGSHVKEGLDLAKMYKLPDVITAMIPQHHGTKKIGFFYQKAKDSTDPTLQKVEEKDFKYPGPRPQSREAAILMLADGAEAAVRSIKDKTQPRIQQVVENLVDKSFTEGQLSECELTLKDLNEIAKAFTRILSSIYHQRIEYPKETLEKNKDEISVFEEEDGSASGDNNKPSQ